MRPEREHEQSRAPRGSNDCLQRTSQGGSAPLIGDRKAFIQAVLAYLCLGGLLGVGLAFYGRRWVTLADQILVFCALAIYGVASLMIAFLAWHRVIKGKPIISIQLHHLFPKRIQRWIVGESETGFDDP